MGGRWVVAVGRWFRQSGVYVQATLRCHARSDAAGVSGGAVSDGGDAAWGPAVLAGSGVAGGVAAGGVPFVAAVAADGDGRWV